MFLPAGWLMAVLPPTDESTCASSVVGTCTKGTPRMYRAAAKPVMSPTTPPPSANSTVCRSQPSPSRRSKIRFSVGQSLNCSPSGNSSTDTAR